MVYHKVIYLQSEAIAHDNYHVFIIIFFNDVVGILILTAWALSWTVEFLFIENQKEIGLFRWTENYFINLQCNESDKKANNFVLVSKVAIEYI